MIERVECSSDSDNSDDSEEEEESDDQSALSVSEGNTLDGHDDRVDEAEPPGYATSDTEDATDSTAPASASEAESEDGGGGFPIKTEVSLFSSPPVFRWPCRAVSVAVVGAADQGGGRLVFRRRGRPLLQPAAGCRVVSDLRPQARGAGLGDPLDQLRAAGVGGERDPGGRRLCGGRAAAAAAQPARDTVGR